MGDQLGPATGPGNEALAHTVEVTIGPYGGTTLTFRCHEDGTKNPSCWMVCPHSECEEGCRDPERHEFENCGECMVETWLENSDADECLIDNSTSVTVPIEYEWHGEGVDWKFAHTAAAVSEARDAAVGEVVKAAHEAADELDEWDGHPSVALGGCSPGGVVRFAVHEVLGVGGPDGDYSKCPVCRAALQPDHADEDSERAKFASECCQDCRMHPHIGCQWWCKNNKPDHANAGDEAPTPQDSDWLADALADAEKRGRAEIVERATEFYHWWIEQDFVVGSGEVQRAQRLGDLLHALASPAPQDEPAEGERAGLSADECAELAGLLSRPFSAVCSWVEARMDEAARGER